MEGLSRFCRRCGGQVVFKRVDEELRFYYGNRRWVAFNEDGTVHSCQIQIDMPKERIENCLFSLGEIERCRFSHPNRAKVALHHLRHGRKVALQLFEEFDRRLEWSRWRLKLCEKLLYMQWHKLWSLPTHNYHYRAVDNFFKWFREYYENLYPHTVNLQYALARLVDQNFYDHVPRKFYKVDVTEPLKEFNYQLNQILKTITLIRDVTLSNATKAEKDYWLRQIRQATELEGIRTGYDYGRGELIGRYERQTLVLNFEEKINDVKEELENSFKDVYAELTAKEDHGWFIILELDSKTEAGMKMLTEVKP